MKSIQGYGGLYKVTKDGKVYSERLKRYLKQQKYKHGYLYVGLYTDKRKYKTIHRLVAETFIPNSKKLSQVNHKDGNKENNHISNLEWCTQSGNMQHSWEIGTSKMSQRMLESLDKKREKALQVLRKLTSKDVRKIRRLNKEKGIGCRRLARRFNVSKSCIDKVLNNKTYKNI